MGLLPGQLVGFTARRDRRVFRVLAEEGEFVALVCPCCGQEGRATVRDLLPLEDGEVLARLGIAPIPTAPPSPSAAVPPKSGGRRRRRRRGGR